MSERPEQGTQAQTPDEVARLLSPPAVPSFSQGDALPGITSWRLERRIGGGGFGQVWLVKHEWKDERRAVKFCLDPQIRTRLVTHEKKIVVRVMRYANNHPNIVPLLDCNLDGEFPWLMYEYVEGGTLADAVASWRALPLARRFGRAVKTLHGIASALATCHRLDPPIVHRDIKPHNILLTGSTPRVTDFGLSGAVFTPPAADETSNFTGMSVRLPTMLQAMGTLRYAPPEQMFGSPPDPRDDVYALGITAYQLFLCDLKTVPGTDAVYVLQDLKLPAELIALVVKSVAIDPARRIRDASEWEARLASLMPREATSVGGLGPEPGMLNIKVPGVWYSRQSENPEADWEEVASTPAVVTCRVDQEYKFKISSNVTMSEVVGLADLHNVPCLHTLDLSECYRITDDDLEYIHSLTQLRSLDLTGCGIGDGGLVYITSLTKLQFLNLSGCEEVTDEGLSLICMIPGLRSLNLSGCGISAISQLQGIAGLQFLDLNECSALTDQGLVCNNGLAALHTLILSSCEGITDRGVVNLASLRGLASLDLTECPSVTAIGITALQEPLPNCVVSTNCFPWNLIMEAGIEKGISPIRSLDLSDGYRGCELNDGDLTIESMQILLRHALHLEELDLSGCSDLTDEWLAVLQGFAALRVLKLGGCYITDAGLRHLVHFPSLEFLDVSGCSITGASLLILTGLANLRGLDLSGCDFEPVELLNLKSFARLQNLYLSGCGDIADEDLRHLHTLGNLQSLNLEYIELSDEAISALKTALPKCGITH